MPNENERKKKIIMQTTSINVFRKTDKIHLHSYLSHFAIFPER